MAKLKPLFSRIFGLAQEMREAARKAVRVVEISGPQNATLKVTIEALRPTNKVGLTGYAPRYSVKILGLEFSVSLLEDGGLLNSNKSVKALASILDAVQTKLGLYPIPTKPSAVGTVFSIAEGKNYCEISYLAVDSRFVKENGPVKAGEEGVSALVNFLARTGKFPVGFDSLPVDKLGALSKYLNHNWDGSLQEVYVCIPPEKVTAIGMEADGLSYVAESQWYALITGFGKLPWKEEKLRLLQTPRVIKPVMVGAGVFGKGTMMPLSDAAWEKMFPGIPQQMKGLPVVVADKNFVKFLSAKATPNQKGNIWIVSKLGIHDAPEFGIGEVEVEPSTLLRTSLTQAQIKAWAASIRSRTAKLLARIKEEGPSFLALRKEQIKDDGSVVLNKDEWMTRPIFRQSEAAKVRSVAALNALSEAVNVSAYQLSGYAVAPVGELEELYQLPGVSHLDVFVHPDDYEKYLLSMGRYAKTVTPGTEFVISRFPAILPTAFHQGRVLVSSKVPRCGVVIHPAVWYSKQGDFDGDTVNVRLYPGLAGLGHKLSLEDVLAASQPKGANGTDFERGKYTTILAQQYIAQSLTGLVDGGAFNQLLYHTNDNPTVAPQWDYFGGPAEDLQTLLTGVKKAVILPDKKRIARRDVLSSVLTRKASGEEVLGYFEALFPEIGKARDVHLPASQKGKIALPPSKFGIEEFVDAVREALRIAYSITIEKKGQLPEPKPGSKVELLAELTKLSKELRPDGIHVLDEHHKIAMETVRLYFAADAKAKGVTFEERVVAFAKAALASEAAHGAVESALSWAQRIYGAPLPYVEYEYILVFHDGNSGTPVPPESQNSSESPSG